ncbi:MAG: hypothetical protein AB7S26_21545 [Sandaracinaceae bacterium]
MLRNVLFALGFGAFGMLAAAPASAQVSPYVGIGIGPAITIDDFPNQVRVEQEIGLTFGHRDGFYLSFNPAQSWGNDFWMLVFPVGLGGTADLFHNRDVRFQIGGGGTVGVAISDRFDTPGTDPQIWFHLTVGGLVRLLVLDDRLAIYLRPVSFEFAIADRATFGWGNEAIRYFLAGGIQYYF